MLNRLVSASEKTILKLAEALNLPARELWPDIVVADMLDAVASFQQDDYVITDAEARAFADTSKKNRPEVQAKVTTDAYDNQGSRLTAHPHQLFAVPFTEADQARLIGFSCGGEPRSAHSRSGSWLRCP